VAAGGVCGGAGGPRGRGGGEGQASLAAENKTGRLAENNTGRLGRADGLGGGGGGKSVEWEGGRPLVEGTGCGGVGLGGRPLAEGTGCGGVGLGRGDVRPGWWVGGCEGGCEVLEEEEVRRGEARIDPAGERAVLGGGVTAEELVGGADL
jgi:hypothetical protein